MVKGYYIHGDRIKSKRIEKGLTQEKVCEKALVEVTTLSRMERDTQRRFNYGTINDVCRALNLEISNIVKPPADKLIEIRQPIIVDFRCLFSPEESTQWKSTPLAVSILDIYLLVSTSSPVPVFFEAAQITLPNINCQEKLSIKYKVELSPAGEGWRGVLSSFYHEKLKSGERLEAGYMFFSQNSFFTSWDSFVDYVKYTHDHIFTIEVVLNFDCCKKRILLELSIAQMREFLQIGFQNKHGYPRFIQPDVQKMLIDEQIKV